MRMVPGVNLQRTRTSTIYSSFHQPKPMVIQIARLQTLTTAPMVHHLFNDT